jgi:hypothetical protein
VEALPPPPPPQTTQQALDEFANPTTPAAQPELPPVTEPSLAEEMDDEIPDFGSENTESQHKSNGQAASNKPGRRLKPVD